TVPALEARITEGRSDYREWNTPTSPWLRGEPASTKTPLLPVLFREPGRHDENRLLQQFRMKAPSLGLGTIPPRDHTDQWLFLARHVGLPTRLLDWTEGLLIALLFAVCDGEGEPRVEKSGVSDSKPHLDPLQYRRLERQTRLGRYERWHRSSRCGLPHKHSPADHGAEGVFHHPRHRGKTAVRAARRVAENAKAVSRSNRR